MNKSRQLYFYHKLKKHNPDKAITPEGRSFLMTEAVEMAGLKEDRLAVFNLLACFNHLRQYSYNKLKSRI